MAWVFIVLGLILVPAGVWTAGDERMVCRAASDGTLRADCRIQTRGWWATRLVRESVALGVEGFESYVERHSGTTSDDADRVDWYLEMATHDGSRYRVAAGQPEVEAAVGEARRWLLSGMDGEFVFVSDGFGRGIMTCLIGAGCLAGGLVGLRIGPKARRREAPGD